MEPADKKSTTPGKPRQKGGAKRSVGGASGGVKAVIGGLACRLPKSRNVQEYWQNLLDGVDMIGPHRWPEGLYGLPPRIGAILDADKFDYSFFNMTAEEANNSNPMLRHLLEVVHECVVDSCLPLSALQSTTTGLYLATFGSDYDVIETSKGVKTDHVSVSPYLAGELMRSLSIHGPTVTVDTACSSSIAALNMAVNAIVSGRCTYAIVASCNQILNPMFSQQMFLLNMLCKEGRSRVFDKAAAGYVRAEGFGAILLAGDPSQFPRVYANIRGIGINCDGYKSKGITYPNSITQAKLLKKVYDKAGVDVNEVKYVEAHGTGTQAGDTMETEGIEKIFCGNRVEPLLIGSVKSNIGHTEATAGLASIIKCIQCLKRGEIPANLNFDEPNPGIPGLASGKLKVVDTTTPLNSKYVGVNSFGFGGVNGHVILEAYREVKNQEDFVHVPRHLVIPLTVRNIAGVDSMAEFVSNNRYNSSLLALLSKSLLATDVRQPVRGYIQIGPKEEDFSVCHDIWEEDQSLVYLCLEGLLSNKIMVAPDLLENDTFMRTLKECAKSIRSVYPGLDLVSVLKRGEPLMPCSRVGLHAATALVITLFDCFDQQAGVPFVGMVGCGLGEVAGAYLDGCLGLDQCFSIVDVIGSELDQLAKHSGDRWLLYEVHMDVEYVYRLGPYVQVLCILDSDHVTIAIEASQKEPVLMKIHSGGGVFNLLPCNVPLYSDHLTGVAEKVRKQIRDIIPAPRYWSSSFVSSCQAWNCSKDKATKTVPKLCDADYLSGLLHKPVNLYSANKHLPEDRLLLTLVPTTSYGSSQTHAVSEKHGSYVPQNFSLIVEVSGSRSHSLGSDSLPRMGRKRDAAYSQSEMDESLSVSEDFYDCEKKTPLDLHCLSTTEALCYVLGELHMAGHQPNVGMLFPSPARPLGIESPSLSPLVTWDHSVECDIPHWLEFSHTRKDVELLGEIRMNDKACQEIRSPVAVMLFEVWQELTDKLATPETQTNDDLVSGVRLFDLVIPDESTLTTDDLQGALIQILPSMKLFAVIATNEAVLMSGKFQIEDGFPLPSVPGYNLDINENVATSPGTDRDAQCEKTDVEWDDDWCKFIGACVDFGNLYLEPPLREFTVDWEFNQKEAKECATFLAVVDKATGICRSGGCALHYDPVVTTAAPEFSLSQVAVDDPQKTSISRLMVYSVSGGQQVSPDRVIVCQAEREQAGGSVPVLGIINMNGEKPMVELPLPPRWQAEDLEVVLPYLLASHILYTVAQLQDSHKLLVLPPIDSVSIYLISLASKLGCSVFTSTYDIESRQTLETLFPFIRVIQGNQLYRDLVTLTRGEGVDVCVRVSGGDVQSALKYVSKNGHLIQGIPPSKGSSRGLSMYSKNGRVSLIRPIEAVSTFMDKTPDEAEVLLFDMKSESVVQLSTEGFPEPKGILYNQENVSSFLQPITLARLISLVTEPSLDNVTAADLMEADIICVEKIQGLVAPKPKDYSIADTSCVLKAGPVGGALEAQEGESDTLDRGMMFTPDSRPPPLDPLGPLSKTSSDLVDHGLIMTPKLLNNKHNRGMLSPEVNIISLTEADISNISPKKDRDAGPGRQHFTSTPMMEPGAADARDKPLEESYIDSARETGEKPYSETDSQAGSEVEVNRTKSALSKHGGKPERKLAMTPKRSKVAPPTIVISDMDHKSPSLPQSPGRSRCDSPSRSRLGSRGGGGADSTFQQLMKQKAKLVPPQLTLPKPQVDLLKVAMPMTPMTPALKEIISPKMESNLVPLNKLKDAKERPLYIVHPVTGSTDLLESLGEQLKIPCFGIKRTAPTPSDSIANVASFYRNAITMTQPRGPYKICGYSFGCLIAFEMALQFQAAGHEVEKLIFLDGSPMYIQSQITSALKHLPTNASKAQVSEALEVGSLVNWMKLYGVTQELAVTYGLLRKIPSLEDRITTAVDLTFKNAIVSSNRSKTKWLTAKEKLLKQKQQPRSGEEKAGGQFADAAKELMRHMRHEKASVFVNHVTMASLYQIQAKFHGNIFLHRVKASEVFEAVDLPADYGASKLCDGQVALKFYDGNHESFLSKQRLSPLVHDLHKVLNVS